MFPFSPFIFPHSNRYGIPLIESVSVTSNETNAIITIANNTFRRLPDKGILILRVNTAIPTDAATLPILIASNGESRPLTLAGGTNATASEITGVGIYQIFYNKRENVLQLMTVGGTAV